MALNVKYCVSKTCQIVGLDKVILHGGRFAPRTCQWQRKPTKTAPANVKHPYHLALSHDGKLLHLGKLL